MCDVRASECTAPVFPLRHRGSRVAGDNRVRRVTYNLPIDLSGEACLRIYVRGIEALVSWRTRWDEQCCFFCYW